MGEKKNYCWPCEIIKCHSGRLVHNTDVKNTADHFSLSSVTTFVVGDVVVVDVVGVVVRRRDPSKPDEYSGEHYKINGL